MKKIKNCKYFINKEDDNSEVKYRTEIIKNNEQKILKFVKIKLTKYHRNIYMTKTFKLNHFNRNSGRKLLKVSTIVFKNSIMSISSKLKTLNSLYSSGVKGWKSLIWNTSMAKMKRSWPLMMTQLWQ